MQPNIHTSDPTKDEVNVPESELPIKPMTMEMLGEAIQERLLEINKEFTDGLDFIRKYHKSVTFFGSARFKENHPYYEQARVLARRLADNGYAVLTGGGPGIMEGGNRGAYEAGGSSLGLTIELPQEQATNPYVTGHVGFHYFFTRKVCLSFSAEAFVYFPGGFGTLDEFFEIITLIQTKKIPRVPVILVGKEYWAPLHGFIQKTIYEKFQAIDEIDMDLYTILDDPETIVELIKIAPVRFDA